MLFLAVCVCAVGGVYGWGVYHLRSARRHADSLRFLEASRSIDRCLKIWWYRPTVLIEAGRLARRRDDFVSAERFYRSAIDRGADPEVVTLELAMLRAQRDGPDTVLQFLREQVENDHPESVIILEAAARGFLKLQRYNDALFLIGLWMERNPDAPRAHYCRGQVFEALGPLDQAVLSFRRAVSLAPHLDEARIRLANILVETADPWSGLEEAENVFRRNPDETNARLVYAKCLFAVNDFKSAEPVLDEHLQRFPSDEGALVLRARLFLENDRPADAESAVRSALRLRPGGYESHFVLHEALRRQRKTREAVDIKRRMDEIVKDISRLREILADELSRSPKDPNLYTEVGAIFLRSGEIREGIRWLEDAVRIDSRHQPAHRTLADYYERTGNAPAAEQHRRMLR